MVNQRGIGLVPHRRDQRDRRFRRRPHHNLFVEAPQILQRPAAARHDDHIGARHRATRHNRVEPPDRRRHLGRTGGALHRHRPDQHMARKPVAQPVQDIADHRTRRRSDDPDHRRQIGDRLFPCRIEQPLGSQRRAPPLQHRHQRADARRGDVLDDHLILRSAGEGGQPPGGDHLHAFLGLHLQARDLPLPAHRIQTGAVVLEVEVQMPRAGLRHPPHLAPHPHQRKLALDHAANRARQFGDGEFGAVAGGGRRFVLDQVGCQSRAPSAIHLVVCRRQP